MAGVTESQVIDKLKQVFDPEIPVDVWNFGLIYGIRIDGGSVAVTMTLTSEACPVAKALPESVRSKVEELAGVERCSVAVVFEPRWTPERITPEGRAILGPADEGEDGP